MVCSGDELVCNAPERCACSQQPAWQTACTGTGGCSGTYDGCEADGTTLRCTCPAAPSCSDQTVGYGAPCTGSSGCRGKQLCDGGALACAAPSSCTSRILFSEVAPGGSGHDEFIELHNSGATSADLSGMKLYYRYDGGSTPLVIPMATIPAGTSVRPGGYFLLTRSGSYTGSVPGDLTFTTNVLTSYYSLWLMKAGNTEADDKTLIKTFSNAGNPITSHPSVVDVASVGSAGIGEGGQPNAWSSSYGTQVSLERKGRASSTAASMAGGGADATLGNGQDSNNSAADFVVRTVRDPQNSQSSVEP